MELEKQLRNNRADIQQKPCKLLISRIIAAAKEPTTELIVEE